MAFLVLFSLCTRQILFQEGSIRRIYGISAHNFPQSAQHQAHSKCLINICTNYKTTVQGIPTQEEIKMSWKITNQPLTHNCTGNSLRHWTNDLF